MRTFSISLALLTACNPPPAAPTAPACAWEDGAYAAVLTEGAWSPEGPDALARPGDLLLANGRAAFVIQGPDAPRTYYHYGGIPIDAAPMAGCTQAAPEVFGELGIVPARLELADFEQSTMRQLRAERAEVIADGADGGSAHVRVTGVDDTFWLVDLTLTREVAADGGVRPLSGPMGVAITVDYVLPPGSATLEISVTTTNLTDAENPYIVGAIAFPSDRTPIEVYADSAMSVAGFSLDVDVPWMTMSSGETAYALAVDTPSLVYADVSGARALLDANAVFSDSRLDPAGQPGATRVDRMWLAAAAGAENAAVQELHAVQPTFNGEAYALRRVAGRVEGASGPASVDVQRQRSDGSWRTLDRIGADASGAFEGQLPDLAGLRLIARAGLRDPSEPLELDAGELADLRLRVGPAGTLTVAVDDGQSPIPAKLSLYREGVRRHMLFVPPAGEAFELPSGDWEVSVTRGFEHQPVHTTVSIPEGGEAPLRVSLPRVVDTAGWISVDGHVHSSPSADSDVLPELRFATVAAAGLDVMVQTDHEAIADMSAALAASPYAGFMATVIGEEVTASSPEHLNMYGVQVTPEDGPRGAPVRWQGLDIGEIYDAMRARGAGVVQLNHPGYMNDVQYDPLTGAPRLTDATAFGLRADQALWSWSFDAVELLNGHKYIFGGPERPGSDGLFTAWQSFLHHGHRITAMGTSDVHGLETPGTPCSYVPGADDLASFVEGPVLEAITSGRALVNAGAFATVTLGDEARGFVAGMGDTFTVGASPVSLQIVARALPEIRVDRVVVLANCDTVAELPATAPTGIEKLATTVPLTLARDANVVIVVVGSGPYPRGLEQPPDWVPRAISNPIYVDVDGNGVFDPPGGKACDLRGLPVR